MSRSSSVRAAIAALIAGVPLALAAQTAPVRAVGLESASERESAPRALAVVEPGPSKVRIEDAAPRTRSRQLFRCWQYGKLIYEGPGGQVALDRGQGPLRIGVGTTVQLYDLKSATCILEQPGG